MSYTSLIYYAMVIALLIIYYVLRAAGYGRRKDEGRPGRQ